MIYTDKEQFFNVINKLHCTSAVDEEASSYSSVVTSYCTKEGVEIGYIEDQFEGDVIYCLWSIGNKFV